MFILLCTTFSYIYLTPSHPKVEILVNPIRAYSFGFRGIWFQENMLEMNQAAMS